jgi:hypothetical protein
MLRPSHTPDAVRAVIAPAKATKRRTIDPHMSKQKSEKLQRISSGAFCFGTTPIESSEID